MKKKEILIIVLILLITLGVAFSSVIIDFFKKDEIEEQIEDEYITISFKGELLKEIDIKTYKGVNFGYLYQFLNNYINSYSIIDIDFKTEYFESTEIYIKSSDNYIENVEITIDKIGINQALEADLIKLYGIGEKRALRIIEYRKNKTITDWDELKQLLEVSDYVIEKIKEEAFL